MAMNDLCRADSLSTIGKVTERCDFTARNAEIAQSYLAGEPMRSIAARFGISLSRVSYICKAQGARLDREALRARYAAHSRRNMNDPAIRAKISATIAKRWAAGHWAGRRKIFGDQPERREEYLVLRDAFGAAYARQAMGIAA